jgi:MFS family permease
MIIGGLEPSIIGLIIAATSLGAFMSFIPASYCADTFGRKWCVGIGSCLVITSSLVQIGVKNHWVFFGMRVLAGIGVGTAQTAAPLLATEIAHPRQRQTATALYNTCWCVGSIASASITFATLYMTGSWSWRVPCLLQATYPVVQLIGLFIVPESPRWLISKNKTTKAYAILAKYHANGSMDDILVQHEFDQICKTINAENATTSHWSSFFSSKGDMHRLFICVLAGLMQEWGGNGMRNP